MDIILSYCGIICKGCPIYWATYENNKEKKEKIRIEIARKSNELNKTNYASKDIVDCEGCLSDGGILFPGCKNCQIRNCAKEKKIPNCAYCSEYACETLNKFFEGDPESKIRLDFMRYLV